MKKIIIILLVVTILLGIAYTSVKADPPFPVPTRKPTKTPKLEKTQEPTIIYIVVTATDEPTATVTETLTPTATETLEPTTTWTVTPTIEEPVEESKSNTVLYLVVGAIGIYLVGLTILIIVDRRKK